MTSNVARTLFLVTLLGLAFQPVPAAAEDPFVAKYLAAEKKLLDRYVHNRKVTTRSKFYRLDKNNTPVLPHSSESTSISGKDAFRAKGRRDYQDEHGRHVTGELFGWLRIPGDGYSLTQGDTPGSYRVNQRHNSPKFASLDVSVRPPEPFLYPLIYGGDDGGPYTLGSVLRSCGQFVPETRVHRTLISASPTTWQGKPAVAVKVRNLSLDLVSTTYVDPANDYAELEFESETAVDVRVGVKPTMKPPIRREGVLTYAPSAEGVPLPTKYEFWYVLPDGRKQPWGLVEFLEYTRYTPTADDFDLEKQFGVKPPPEPSPATETPDAPDSESSHDGVAGWRRWWPTAAVAVAVVAVATVLAFRRRRGSA